LFGLHRRQVVQLPLLRQCVTRWYACATARSRPVMRQFSSALQRSRSAIQSACSLRRASPPAGVSPVRPRARRWARATLWSSPARICELQMALSELSWAGPSLRSRTSTYLKFRGHLCGQPWPHPLIKGYPVMVSGALCGTVHCHCGR
jgi:hypothetical protein